MPLVVLDGSLHVLPVVIFVDFVLFAVVLLDIVHASFPLSVGMCNKSIGPHALERMR